MGMRELFYLAPDARLTLKLKAAKARSASRTDGSASRSITLETALLRSAFVTSVPDDKLQKALAAWARSGASPIWRNSIPFAVNSVGSTDKPVDMHTCKQWNLRARGALDSMSCSNSTGQLFVESVPYVAHEHL